MQTASFVYQLHPLAECVLLVSLPYPPPGPPSATFLFNLQKTLKDQEVHLSSSFFIHLGPYPIISFFETVQCLNLVFLYKGVSSRREKDLKAFERFLLSCLTTSLSGQGPGHVGLMEEDESEESVFFSPFPKTPLKKVSTSSSSQEQPNKKVKFYTLNASLPSKQVCLFIKPCMLTLQQQLQIQGEPLDSSEVFSFVFECVSFLVKHVFEVQLSVSTTSTSSKPKPHVHDVFQSLYQQYLGQKNTLMLDTEEQEATVVVVLQAKESASLWSFYHSFSLFEKQMSAYFSTHLCKHSKFSFSAPSVCFFSMSETHFESSKPNSFIFSRKV